MSLKMAALCLDTSLEMLWPLCCHRSFSFIIMSCKIATLCLDGNLETLRPLCCRHMLRLQAGGLCCCHHKGSPQALQAVLTLLAHHVLQNKPQFIVQSFDVCTPCKPILSTDEGQMVPLQPLLSCLGLLGKN